jgi:Zn-dependent peptidase ImmA (M78 family)
MLSPRDYRTAQLNAVHQARRALRDLGLERDEWVDPFLAIERAGALLMFQPLRSLCGAYLPKPPGGDAAGIFLSTYFPLSVQRFTAAHELGHLRMGHAISVDREEDILPRAATARIRDDVGDPTQEVAAEAFAGFFLMPQRQVTARMDALGIGTNELRSADAVYELSLWFGASYSAMVWHLVSLKLLRQADAIRLAKVRPKQIKEALAGRDALADWHNDVWPLSAEQSGQIVHARVGDALSITLPSHASGGYLWDASSIDADAWELLRLEPMPSGTDGADSVASHPGRSLEHQALLRVRRNGAHSLALAERRPWAPARAAAEFRVTVVAQAPFEPGLAPARRRQHLQLVTS